MCIFDVLAATPPGVCDPAIAIAACRAGGLGLIDLEFASDVGAALDAVGRLERYTDGPFGIKVGRESRALLDTLLSNPPPQLRHVLIAGGEQAGLTESIERLTSRQIQVLWEATSLDEAILGQRLGASGLVLKGNEAGGRVGETTAFVLLQQWHKHLRANEPNDALPIWVQGGIGRNTAAACAAAGAAGVLLDSQLLLTRESPLQESARRRLAAFDGSETRTLGASLGETYRAYHRPGSKTFDHLVQEAERIEASKQAADNQRQAWRRTIAEQTAAAAGDVVLIGQDAALAAPLAERYLTVGGIITAIREQVRHNLQVARQTKPLAEAAPLAASHGTRFPILQGPMTRVSDTAAFADAVSHAGGLPFLALALMRGKEMQTALDTTRERLGDRPWGVGLLGFLPPEIRREQIAAICDNPPPFALIAGGRPDQARQLEDRGIPTYLHVPSPGLLKLFLRDGARRFVFEGRECGGHVGPRTSFLLWETMCDILLAHLGPTGRGEQLHVVFAGGIHDALSGAMVAALAAPLVERGVKIGILMGTAYLFTKEAVAAGAIVERFQNEAVACRETVLFETGPGHAVRCIKTPYYDVFESERQRLKQEGRSHEEIVRALEGMNIGRLRVASKGLDRVAANNESTRKLRPVSDKEQYDRGMYMIGQVAGLRDCVTTMADLHEDVSGGVSRLLESLPQDDDARGPQQKPSDIAIVGMASYYPGAFNLRQYWQNILARKYAVTEIPASHWDWRLYYDPDPFAPDKIVSKWGGFLDDIPFDPFSYGITPKSMPSLEPLHLMLLESVRHAIRDAGYENRPFNRERTAAILGVGGGGSPMSVTYGFRACIPLFDTIPNLPIASDEIMSKARTILPEWTEDSFPGFLFNVAVGRVANRFNLGGSNYAIDAACASSLASVDACVRELEQGTADVAIAMGADTVQTPFAYMAFSKTHALSRQGRCRPFDNDADGIVLSEGFGVVVLKRLADAQRDGDKIYAVIKGLGASSDGKDKGLTAPNSAGQLRALRRAYDKAGVSPASVELIEAHGTGTVAGDKTEAEALTSIFCEAGAPLRSCALGSVKSMIGHSKCAAGIAGLIKTALALHHKVLPPTLVERPNPKANFEQSSLYLNTEARPWVHGPKRPRRAGVSAFGFGGTNFHAVLEEYTGDYLQEPSPAQRDWPSELFVWRAASRRELAEAVAHCRSALAATARPPLAELAASLWKSATKDAADATLAVIATSLDDLQDKLDRALTAIRSANDQWLDPRGIYFAEKPADHSGKVALLFPGQGSQLPNMQADLAMNFADVRQPLDRADRILADSYDRPLSKFIFPPSTFTPEAEADAAQQLARTDVAQPAIGAASLGMLRLLTSLGLQADFLAGHSYGEYVALCAAGVISEDELIRISQSRGSLIAKAAEADAGGMLAVDTDDETARQLCADLAGVTVANINAPRQTVLSGSAQGLEAVLTRCRQRGIAGRPLPVACAFHSSLVADANEPLARRLRECRFASPRKPVFSNTTAEPYPNDPEEITRLLSKHLVSPVHFRAEVEAMYEAGARVFVEVGPQGVLTNLTKQILADKPHTAVASDAKGRTGLVQLQHLLASLLTSGIPVRLDRLFADRDVRTFDVARLADEAGVVEHSPSTWIVNSCRCRPLNAPEPPLLGQTTHLSSAATAAATAQPTRVPNLDTSTTSEPRIMTRPTISASDGPTQHEENGQPVSGDPALDATDADEAAQVMLGFQNLMSQFLETQQRVMQSYLQGAPGDAPAAALAPATPKAMTAVSASPQANAPTTETQTVVAPPSSNGQSTPPLSQAANTADRIDPPTKPSAQAPALDRDSLAERLVELVSERTGYPPEMLDVDLDLEADLGIDSIKRIEILGSLAESISDNGQDLDSNLDLEKLSSTRTLRGILDYLDQALHDSNSDTSAQPASITSTPTQLLPSADASPSGDPAAEIQRGLVTLVDAPLPRGASVLIPSGAVLLTDDGRGIARELAARLADFGQQTALLRMPCDTPVDDEDVFYADLCDAEAVDGLLERLRDELGPIAGLVHLLPFAETANGELAEQRARRDVKSLYLLARGLEEDMCRCGEQGAALLLAPTAMGGALGFGDQELPDPALAGHGGIVGFVKCLGMEWPEVMVRAVDLDARREVHELVDRLLGELADGDGPLEVGYVGSRRVTWEPVASPLSVDAATPAILDADSTVLITGGARGITSAIALEMARRDQPRLILVGRSAAPPAEEADDTASLTTAADIKAALIDRLKREGRPAVPAEVESAYQRLIRDREIRDNLARIRAAGAEVEYHPVDVRDETAMAALLDDIETRHGAIDGVIHGAGVIEDKLVRDKTPESFDRVFGTKVESAMILSRHLKPDRLKFCIFFASIASRYGNRGQADYAAANEVLSKLAADLDRRWPARVASIAWGPWSELGMVSHLEKHLAARGISLISPEVGSAMLLDELNYGSKGHSEVMIAGGAQRVIQPARKGEPRGSLPQQVTSAGS